MKILGLWSKALGRCDQEVVAALVSRWMLIGIAGNCVKWLMSVSHKVNDEAQRVGPSCVALRMIFENVKLLSDCDFHILRFGLQLRSLSICTKMVVDVVPRPRLRPLTANVISPGACINEGLSLSVPTDGEKAVALRLDRRG